MKLLLPLLLICSVASAQVTPAKDKSVTYLNPKMDTIVCLFDSTSFFAQVGHSYMRGTYVVTTGGVCILTQVDNPKTQMPPRVFIMAPLGTDSVRFMRSILRKYK